MIVLGRYVVLYLFFGSSTKAFPRGSFHQIFRLVSFFLILVIQQHNRGVVTKDTLGFASC